MPLALLRIDERLIHGQVLVGWGERLGLRYYVVVDDELAESEWEQEIWASALGDDTPVEFFTAEEAGRRFAELDLREPRGALLTRGTQAMRSLAESGCLEGRRVNIGGVHDGPGRRRVLDYLYLSDGELDDLRAIGRRTGSVSARALPTGPETPLSELTGS